MIPVKKVYFPKFFGLSRISGHIFVLSKPLLYRYCFLLHWTKSQTYKESFISRAFEVLAYSSDGIQTLKKARAPPPVCRLEYLELMSILSISISLSSSRKHRMDFSVLSCGSFKPIVVTRGNETGPRSSQHVSGKPTY